MEGKNLHEVLFLLFFILACIFVLFCSCYFLINTVHPLIISSFLFLCIFSHIFLQFLLSCIPSLRHPFKEIVFIEVSILLYLFHFIYLFIYFRLFFYLFIDLSIYLFIFFIRPVGLFHMLIRIYFLLCY